MTGKKRIGKIGTAVVAGVMMLAFMQGCKTEEDAGKLPETTATPAAVTEPVVPTEIPTDEPEAVTPTTAPEQETPTEAPTEAPGEEVTPTPGEMRQELPEYTLTVGNELYFEFAYEFDALTFRSENPDIVQATFMEGEYDWEEDRETTGVMLYGIANGATELTVTDVRTGQEVRWAVTVEKPATESGAQKLIDWLLTNGETTEIGDKVLTKGTPESGGQAMVEYAAMDKSIRFYYMEVLGEEKIEWNLIPTEHENTEYYITMRVDGEFITAIIDPVTYTGGSIAFEKGWFKIPVEEEMQKKANEISGRAYEAVRSLLYEETGMKMGEAVE